MRFQGLGSLVSEERARRSYSEGYWSEERVCDLLAKRAADRPDATVIIDGDHQVSWGDLHRLSRAFARQLHALGIGRGDPVILQLPNWWEYFVGYYGLHLVGAIVMQLGVDWRSREVEFALGLAPVKAAIVPRTFRDFDFIGMYRDVDQGHRLPLLVARSDARRASTSTFDVLNDVLDASPDAEDAEGLGKLQLGPDEISRVVFTSGTTGVPKAILHTTNTTRVSCRALARTHGFGPGDVALSYLPLSTNAGTAWSLYLPLETGTAVALLDRFSADRALQLMEEARVSLYCGSPTSLQALTENADLKRRNLKPLKLIISSGSSCPREVIRSVRSRFTASFVEAYGMNEIGFATTTRPDDDPNIVDGTVGRPYPGIEARVVDDQGRDQEPGRQGELLLRGPGMCFGYHASPELSASTWDTHGWLRTGDFVSRDEQGNITLVSRKKDLIIRGGANVSPREVEEAMASHPKVREVTVLGLPDPVYGEAVCACVISRGEVEMTLEELRSFLTPRIAFYKIPTQLYFFDSFPTTSMGKVRRNMLRHRILGSSAKVE